VKDNVVPSQAALTVNVRQLPGHSRADIETALTQTLTAVWCAFRLF
jgi:acetylornithine deacetylase/succinyl-diaminopimelate desuccinylase-like protein